jgi:hypothetical protein
VDGDGLDDILVGASENGDGGLSAGKAYLILGSSLGGLTEIDLRTADYTFVGENEGDIAGRRVSSAGDVDGDGLDDILIGAGGVEDGALNVGAAYLILGSSLGAIPEIDLSNADYHFVGQEGGTGDSLSSAGDVDGDGLDDILFGAPFFGGIGRAYLILGSSFGASPEMRLDQADYYFRGEQSGDDAGCSVASAGDVDGDGLDDILIGSQFYDDGGDSDAGKAYLIFGSSLAGKSQIDLFDADYIFAGEDDTDNAGSSVSSAGDVDGDGLDDILIGAPQADASVGKAYLVLGSSLGVSSEIDLYFADYWFMGEKGASIGYAGATVKSAGDVDGDGLSDILLGAKGGEYYPGKVYLVLGSSLGASSVMDLSTADYSLVGEEGGDAVGDHVSNAGDVDGDGLNDILVGATGNDDAGSNAGKAYLIFSHL